MLSLRVVISVRIEKRAFRFIFFNLVLAYSPLSNSRKYDCDVDSSGGTLVFFFNFNFLIRRRMGKI